MVALWMPLAAERPSGRRGGARIRARCGFGTAAAVQALRQPAMLRAAHVMPMTACSAAAAS